ncbi:non-specific lipid transfer protein GPI-anchored 12-like [Rutidosis leptorrhynchoides]|uniref:non-specific lipid transfer protein GPI-anchored 12-like n=1 Tax=Rutidosis leptorrhynchoides TaxID=125765 RepID=UPI003A99A70A
MVRSNTTTMAVAMLVGMFFVGLPCMEAQSSSTAPVMSPGVPMAMAPTTDCMTAIANVSDCLTFVQNGSTLAAPDKKCCPEFAGLLESNPICLCQLVGQADSFGVDIGRALMLPDACKLEIPSLDSCPASPTPAPTPSGDTPGSTTAGPIPDGGTSMSPTASGNGSSGASSTIIHDLSTFICLAVAIFIAYYF